MIASMTKKPKPSTIAELLTAARLQISITPMQCARLLGVSRQRICNVEMGRSHVSLKLAAEWAVKLGGIPEAWVQVALQERFAAQGIKLRVQVFRTEP